MPLVFRAMLSDNGRPAIGRSGTTLGVRIPGDERPDVRLDAENQDCPGEGSDPRGPWYLFGCRSLDPYIGGPRELRL
jgi:hypothetical protein